MKLKIDGYEVEIKAKSPYKNRANKDDTYAILNSISLLASTARDGFREHKVDALAEWADRIGSEIYEMLKANHVYD